MSIEKELKKSKEYLLDFVNGKYFNKDKMKQHFSNKTIGIPKLTLKNVARVEAMIQTDSRYSNNSYKFNEDTSEDYLKNLKGLLESPEKSPDYEDKLSECIYNIVRTIDKENSTHLKGLKNDNVLKKNGTDVYQAIAEAIINKVYELKENLMKPEVCLSKDGLFRIIEAPGTGGRTNTSFASKFCHYACFYLFDDENRDNYSIYDEVMRSTLPIYIKLYKNKMNNIYEKKKKNNPNNLIYVKVSEIIEKEKYNDIKNALDAKCYKNNNDENCEFYQVYQEVIDGVRNVSGKNISRNGFDHLLWYYFKGKNEKEIVAIYNCIK